MKRTLSPASFRWDHLVATATSDHCLGPCGQRKCVMHPVTAALLSVLVGVLLLGCYQLELGQTLATWTRIAAPVHHAQAAEPLPRTVAAP